MKNTERYQSAKLAPRLTVIGGLTDFKKRFRQLLFLGLHLFAHRKYVQQVHGFLNRGLMHDNIFQRYKYLGNYLSLSLSNKTRQFMILSHYNFVYGQLTSKASLQMRVDGIVLWKLLFDSHQAIVLLKINDFAPMEGEWQLQFFLDSDLICTVSFIFTSGIDFDRSGKMVCLVGGVQGSYGCRTKIRTAAKANSEIAPMTMLILATKALAQAFKIARVFGVSSENQVVRSHGGDRIKIDYDNIWLNEGATHVVNGFFSMPLSVAERNPSKVTRSHRRRANIKRQRKGELFDDILMQAKIMLVSSAQYQSSYSHAVPDKDSFEEKSFSIIA